MRISDWSSDVCSSDLINTHGVRHGTLRSRLDTVRAPSPHAHACDGIRTYQCSQLSGLWARANGCGDPGSYSSCNGHPPSARSTAPGSRSEEHTSELQSLMRITYGLFCLT